MSASRARAGSRPARCSRTPSRSRRRARSRSCWSSCPASSPTAITERLKIPTIGIGAGAGCSGQIQVITDTLGLGDWTPKHARRYADLHGTILDAIGRYRADVEAGDFPGTAETVLMDPGVLDDVLGRSEADRAVAGGGMGDIAGIPLDRDL